MAEHPYYTAIDTLLTGASVAGGEIYPDQLPNDPPLPAVRIAILTDRPHQRLASGSNVTADVQVDVYADRGDSTNAWVIDQAVRAALDRVDLTVTGFANVHAMCTERGRPFKEDRYYRITSQYRLYGSAA